MFSHIPAVPGIYRITCTTTKKFYIGSAMNLRKRQSQHLSDFRKKTHHNIILQRAWEKYGPESFIFEVIEIVPVASLLEREQHWIDILNPPFNLNPVAGSCLGRKLSPETCDKLRIANLGKTHKPEAIEKVRAFLIGRPVSQETRKKIGDANRGKTGRIPSEETRKKQSEARKGRPHSPEWSENIRRAKMGHPVSLQSRERMRIAHLGKNLGHPVSAQTRAKIRDARVESMQTLVVTDPNGVEYTITGVRQFCLQHNLHQSAIMRVAKGKQRQHKGWKARFI